MKNNYSRFIIIALITIILFLYAVTVKGYGAEKEIYFQTTISGKVVDQEGLPIPGVAVNIKNSNHGTVTNLNGTYNIEAEPNAILVFSYLGFQKQEVPVKGRSQINVSLIEDVTALDEVEINAGYYNTTRRESTGNISRVTAEEIELQPVVSPLQALQGRMAGVEVIPEGSHPGMASTIRIRGINSLREEGNYPLYIIDGVPVNSTPIESYSNLGTTGIDPLNTLNLSNIASIEVLKDADATAIYGSRGANGVVLITTKKAKEGKLHLETSIYSGISEVPKKIDLLNTEQYLQIRNKAFENDGIEPTENNAFDLLIWDQDRYTDWQEVFFGGSSFMTNANLSISGGTSRNNFRLNSSYFKQGTVFLGDYDYRKITTSLQSNHNSNDGKLNLNLSLNFGADMNDLAGYLDLTSTAFELPPNAPQLFNDDGSLHWEEWSAVGLNNPLEGYHNSSRTRGKRLLSNLFVSYEVFEGLELKSSFGYSHFNSNEIVKRPLRSYNPSTWNNRRNRSVHQFIESNSWIIEPQLNYKGAIGKNNFSFLLGATLEQSERSLLGLQGEGYVSESLIGNLSAADDIISMTNPKAEYRYAAIFARIGFDYEKEYFLNLTGRRDGSSRFGPGKRIADFGAVGAAWLFSENPFVKQNLPWISFGKLRGSYGLTGNDQIGDYGYLDAYEATIGPGGLYPNQLANPDFSWEVNKKLEGGLELGFLDDHINLGISWYRNRSSNQLVGYPLPATTGFTTVQANLPATVENRGWEIEFTSHNFQRENFQWRTSLNLTLPENRLVEYPDLEQSSYANTYKIDHPLNILLLYEYTGIDPETGFYTVRDANENGRIDIEDRTQVWDRGREFFGGLANDLTYKNFSLQFLWEFVKQEGTFTLFDAGFRNAQHVRVLEALEPESKFQKISSSLSASRAYSNVLNSTFPIVDASYVRLKTLRLGYSIPVSSLSYLGIESGNVFLHGQNLFTISDYDGLDPATPYYGTSFTSYRTFTIGAQFNF